MTLRVATINFYAGNRQPVKDAEFIDSLGFDICIIQEAHNHLEEIKAHTPSYRSFHHVKPHPTRGSRENLILIHKHRSLDVKGHGSYKTAPAARPVKYCPERYLVWVRFVDANGRKRCVIGTHTQPAVQSRSDGKMLPRSIKRVAGYVMGMRAVAKEARKQRKAGWEPIIGGDLNYRRYPGVRNFVLAFWSPQRVFTRLKMKWVEHAVDYISWPSKMVKVAEGTIPQSKHGADHDWLWVAIR